MATPVKFSIYMIIGNPVINTGDHPKQESFTTKSIFQGRAESNYLIKLRSNEIVELDTGCISLFMEVF